VVSFRRDDRAWRIGTDAEVMWIAGGTTMGLTVTSAIPPVFDAYATVVIPDTTARRESHDREMLILLAGNRPTSPGGLATSRPESTTPSFPTRPRSSCTRGGLTYSSRLVRDSCHVAAALLRDL
jgi:hypothetical protein